MRPLEKASRLLAGPRALLLGLGAALLVALPSLSFGFFADDYNQLAILEGFPIEASPFSLYRFLSGDPAEVRPFLDVGVFPWWTLPNLKLAFWRPLSSALVVLDHALFGHQAAGYHLHSILWYLALVAACGFILRRTLPGAVGGLTLLLFAVDCSHALPVGWLANRNALVAAVPALFGLIAHLRWREQGWRPGLPLSLLGYALGLSGGEAAIGVFAYLGAYELFGREEVFSRRIRALLPAAVLGVGYLVTYKHLGYGAFGSGMYFDAVAEPFAFLRVVPGRILALIGGELSLVPAEVSMLGERAILFQRAVGAVAVTGFVWLLRWAWPGMSSQERRGARWLLAGALLSLLPVTSTQAHDRLLLLPSLGGAAGLAFVIREAARRWRAPGKRWGAGAVLALVALPHLVLSPLIWLAQGALIGRLNHGAEWSARELGELDGGCCAGRDVVIPVDAQALSAVYTPLILRFQGRGLPRSWRVLSMTPCDHRLERTGPERLVLSCMDGQPLLRAEFERLFRSQAHRLRRGDRVELAGLTATVLEEDADEGPTRVEFRFERPLEDRSFIFLSWREGRFHSFAPPSPGGSLVLPADVTLPR